MRALHVPAAGAQPELGELPTPEATEGTVLIRVKAAGLNAIDNGIAAGMMAGMIPHEYPLVLGRDAAGVVEAVGDASTTSRSVTRSSATSCSPRRSRPAPSPSTRCCPLRR